MRRGNELAVWVRAVTTACVLWGASAAGLLHASAWASPAVFSDVTYTKALEENRTNGKFLVIKGTAVWCGPCKQMDRTTWVDEGVVNWINQQGVAIAVDVDESPKDAEALGIEAMPTIIVLKDGREVDRFMGYRDARETLEFLGNVQAGRTQAQMRRERAGKRADENGNVNVEQLLEDARGWMQEGEHARALEEYVWLWDNMVEFDRSFYGVRGSFMAREMQTLAEKHAPAMERFTAMRDALETQLRERSATMETLSDWVILNEVVKDDERTLAWFDRVKSDPGAKASIERVEFRLQHLLAERERWADYALTFDPRRWVAMQRMLGWGAAADIGSEGESPEETAQMRAFFRTHSIEEAAVRYKSLLAADRLDEALALGDASVKGLEGPEVRRALVGAAREVDREGPDDATRERHQRWLREADELEKQAPAPQTR